jgi:hypothetical protein
MRFDETWRARAELAIREALDGARDSTSAAVAKLALQPLIAEFQHQRNVDEAVSWVFTPGTADEDHEARDSLRLALSILPVNTSDRQFELAKQTALAKIRERIKARMQQGGEAQERKGAKRRLI